MKPTFIPLATLILSCGVALAQSAPAPEQVMPQITIDPNARALFNRATAKYQAAQGIRFEVEGNPDEQKRGSSSVSFARPNFLRLNSSIFSSPSQIVGDGTNFFSVKGEVFQKFSMGDEQVGNFLSLSSAGRLGGEIGLMLRSINPLDLFCWQITHDPDECKDVAVYLLPPQVVNGTIATGIRTRYLYRMRSNTRPFPFNRDEETLWFNSDSTLLRLQLVSEHPVGGKRNVFRERIFNQQLNPAFPKDTFVFDPVGLPLASENKPVS